MTRKALLRIIDKMATSVYTRGQTVYQEGQPAANVYIVLSGEFELARKLPRGDKVFDSLSVGNQGA